MDLFDCYALTNRAVLQAKSTDPTTWETIHIFLPVLREHLSCRVCHKLLDRVHNYYSGGFACMSCVVDSLTIEDKTCTSILQRYKKLCRYIYKSPLYYVMCSRNEDKNLVRLINEAIDVSRSTNGHNDLENGESVNKEQTQKLDNINSVELNSSLDLLTIPNEFKTPLVHFNLQNTLDVPPRKKKIQNQPTVNVIPKKKKNEHHWGCRCGNSTTTPGMLTCFGQRCPCYTEQKPCDQCKCRGCRNPKRIKSNDDNTSKLDKTPRKPVTIGLPSLNHSHVKVAPVLHNYTVDDFLQFPSHSLNVDQTGAEVTLGHVNSIFHSP